MHRQNGERQYEPRTREVEVPVREPDRSSPSPNRSPFAIFRGLKAEEAEAIRSAAFKRTFNASETIVAAQEPALHFCLLQEGLVDYATETEDGHEILLRRLVPGDPFGFAALLSHPVGYLGTATSVHEVEALVWQHHIIHHLGTTYPRLMQNALRMALHYVALFVRRHVRNLSSSAEERVAYALTNLASRTGHAFPSGLEVDVKNKELASLADVNPYSVSRFLRRWDRAGVVKKSRGKIIVQRPEYLLAA